MQESSEADVVFEQISVDYPVWERAVRDAAPELPDSEVQDRALRSVLAQFRLDLSHDMLAHLKQRLTHARLEVSEVRQDLASLMPERMRLPTSRGSHDSSPGARTFRDADGRYWTVRERVTDDVSWGRGGRCLVFSSEMAVRRVWDVPDNWRSLSDAELERLSWTT